MVAAAAGCSSSTANSAASDPATSGTSAVAAPSDASSSATSSAPSASASSGTTAPASSASTGSTAPGGAPAVCDNAKLNASLVPPDSGQKASVYVIAVKNTGPACDIDYLPYVWITAGQNSSPEQTRPLIENGLGGGPHIIASGQTMYAGIDLNPQSASDAVAGYTSLAVTANPTPDSSGKDVQDLRLPAPAKVAGAKLGTYNSDKATAIKQIAFASVPEESQH